MSYYLNYFSENREDVVSQLKSMVSLAHEMNAHHYKKDLDELIKQLMQEQFEIIVVGEFSNGKSTLINALVGMEILPSSIHPSTAILNKLHYAENEKFLVHYHDERRRPASVDRSFFKRIVAPKEIVNEEQAALQKKMAELIGGIKYADISLPADILKDGITIIDSPGTSDLDPKREEMTIHYIPKSDAAIILLNATTPLSESDMSLIKDRILTADFHKVFFCVNYADLLRTDEKVQEVKTYITDKLREVIDEPKVFMMSARHALFNRCPELFEQVKEKAKKGKFKKKVRELSLEETGILEFEDELLGFLQYERGFAKLEKPINRGIRLANDMIQNNLQFERKTLNNNIDNIKEASQELIVQTAHTRKLSKQAGATIRNQLDQQGMEIKRFYEKELREISAKALRTLDERYYKDCDLQQVISSIEVAVAPIEKELAESLEKKMKERIEHTIKRENQKIEQEFSGLHEQLSNVVGHVHYGDATDSSWGALTMNNKNSTDDLVENLYAAFKGMGGVLGYVLAGSVAGIFAAGKKVIDGILDFFTGTDRQYEDVRAKVQRRFHDPIRPKIIHFEKQWSSIITSIAEQYLDYSEQQIAEMEEKVDILLRNNKMSEFEIQLALERLDRREESLKSIIQSLEAVKVEMNKEKVVSV